MKTLQTLFALLICCYSFAQGTTQEEYNYVTKGYKIQQESGLDMKKGYSIKPLDVMVTGIVSSSNGFKTEANEAFVSASGLYRNAEVKPCAIIIKYYNRGKNFTEYFCIPSADAHETLWDAHLMRIKEFANDAKALIYECTIRTIAQLAKE